MAATHYVKGQRWQGLASARPHPATPSWLEPPARTPGTQAMWPAGFSSPCKASSAFPSHAEGAPTGCLGTSLPSSRGHGNQPQPARCQEAPWLGSSE